jgi:hypothetical protein
MKAFPVIDFRQVTAAANDWADASIEEPLGWAKVLPSASGKASLNASTPVLSADAQRVFFGYLDNQIFKIASSFLQHSTNPNRQIHTSTHSLNVHHHEPIESKWYRLQKQAAEEEAKWLPLRALLESGVQLLDELDVEDPASRALVMESLNRGADLLQSIWRSALSTFGNCPRLPVLTPLPTGSTDYFWRGGEMTLLLNVPADGRATFAGKRPDGKFKGSVDARTTTPAHLAAWLLNK